MKAPDSAEIFETPASTYWFDKEVLFVIAKNAPPLPMQEQVKQTEEFKKKLGGKKICAIMDVTEAAASSRETREYNTRELPTMFKAIAFITRSALGRMLAHLFLGMKPMSFPVKVFSNEQDAREWIKQYL